MKRACLCLLLLSVVFGATGQGEAIGRLKARLAQTQDERNRVLLLTELAANYQFFKADTALLLCRRAIELAARNRFYQGEIRALTRLGEVYRLSGEYPKALEAHLKAVQLSQQKQERRGEANALSYKALVYLELGDFRQALNYLLQAETIDARLPVVSEAEDAFFRRQADAGFRLSNIGEAYEKLGRLDSALHYQMQALSGINDRLAHHNVRNLQALTFTRLALIKRRQGALSAALASNRKALDIARHSGDLLNQARAHYQLAEVFCAFRRPDSTLFHVREAFALSQKAKQKLLVLRAGGLLSRLYRERNQPDSAYCYQEAASAAKDSLFGPEKFRRLQLLALQEQQRLNELRQERERTNVLIQRTGLLVAMGVSLLFALVLWRGNRRQQRANRVLNEKNEQIETQRTALEQALAELRATQAQLIQKEKLVARRAQMNPHFIFNCLNSIKLYATENQPDKAAEYLTTFSRLIRRVLENSRSERVSLENELEALRLYIELEAMRFKNKLRYEIHVEAGIDAGFVEIPPLLLQPYVENAIWHGLMHKPEGGTVSVRVEQPAENQLRITIADDGVGRAKAAELKSKSATRHKSFGMQVTGERIALINQLYQSQTQVKVHDLVDAEGHPAGTEVVLEIPV